MVAVGTIGVFVTVGATVLVAVGIEVEVGIRVLVGLGARVIIIGVDVINGSVGGPGVLVLPPEPNGRVAVGLRVRVAVGFEDAVEPLLPEELRRVDVAVGVRVGVAVGLSVLVGTKMVAVAVGCGVGGK